MSLKAKLEAVIYAAEEPVTLSQLAALFAAEALEWKAEQEAAAAAAQEADGASAEETQATPSEGQTQPEPEQLKPEQLELEPTTAAETAEEGTSATEDAGQTAAESALDAETEAKRQARLRDREVKAILRTLLDELIQSYAPDERGIEIREIAGGYRMATKPECHDAVRLFIKSLKPALKLSLPALETLAVIAYKQPVTAPEVNEIRGVESSGVLGSLLSRKLITTAGRKQVIGRPILYKTTKEFLLRFGLKDVSELPSMEEFEKIAAIELSESGEEEEVGFEGAEAGVPDSAFEVDESAAEPEVREAVASAEEDRKEEIAEPDVATAVPEVPSNQEGVPAEPEGNS